MSGDHEFDDVPRPDFYYGADILEEHSPDERNAFLEKAYKIWQAKTGYLELEWPLMSFDQSRLQNADRAVQAAGGWLRCTRVLRRLSTNEAARLLGVAKTTYVEIERAEKSGSISLNKLKRISKKLGMELVVGFKPAELPSKTIWNSLESEAIRRFKCTSTTRPGATNGLAAKARFLFESSKVSKEKRWSERPLQLELRPLQ